MPSNEGWDSVFLQALQNSLAQSKAETKWNQELAFRDKQFGLDTQKFEADKEYNNRLLADKKTERQINFAQNFKQVSDFGFKPKLKDGETAPTDPAEFYKAYLASKYGNAFDNPDTPQVDYFIPNSSYNAIEADRKAAEALEQNIALNFIKGDIAKQSIDKFSPIVQAGAKFAEVGDIGGLFTDTNRMWLGGKEIPSGVYYDKNALSNLRNEDQKWQANQADINAANYRAQLQHSASMAGINLERERMNPIQTFKVPDGEGGFTYVDGTASEVRAAYGIAVPANPEEAFTYKVWKDVYNNSNKHGINPSDGYSLEELDKISNLITQKGGDISNAPWLTDAANNAIYDTKKTEYGLSKKLNAWGKLTDPGQWYSAFTGPLFGMGVGMAALNGLGLDVDFGRTQSFGDWENSGGANTAPYQTAIKLQNKINRYNATGAQPRQTLDEYRIRKGL